MLTTGPTICPYAMEHVEVPGVTATPGYTPSDEPTPKLFEVSPDAYTEQIVEISVTGTEETPKILTPSTPDDIATVSAYCISTVKLLNLARIFLF